MEQNKLITAEEIRRRLASARKVTEKKENAKSEKALPTSSPYVQAAAVLVFFDPTKMQPLNGLTNDRKKAINELIAFSELLADTQLEENSDASSKGKNGVYQLHYSLSDKIRREALQQLSEKEQIRAALEANYSQTFSTEQTWQRIFTKCLIREFPSPNDLNLEELNALCRVIGWLSGIKGFADLPDRREVIRRIEMMEMLSPMKHLTGVYKDGKFQEMFRGRRAELSTLRSYVGVAAPQGITEMIGRFFERFKNSFSSGEKKPLQIYGQGGIGKSTLLAKFILEHAEAHQSDRFPFVYLDFDRPFLSALEPETLLIEAARQLSIQYRDLNDLSQDFLAFYHRWNDAYSSLLDSSQTESITLKSIEFASDKERNRNELIQNFLDLARRLSDYESKPFLVILDTFEEVQYKGQQYVKVLKAFLKRLRNQYPLLRTIIAGRAPVPQIDSYSIELGNLDREAAEGYLERIGVTDSLLSRSIARQLGGNPLTLKLAAELVKNYGQEGLLGATQNARGARTGNKLPELEVQGILYKRILEHLHNPEVRKLAHPGMVLRKITPDVIQKVLAEPCDLKVSTLKQAQNLFEKTAREVSLVTRTEKWALRHRTDIRKMMLRLIEREKKDLVHKIHRAALDYYCDKEGLADQAERMYHLLSLDTPRSELEVNWREGMQNYLMGSLDELPLNGQTFLLAKAGREANDISIWETADAKDQYRHLAKQAANLLNSGRAQNALELLSEPVPEQGQEILSYLKVRALLLLQQHENAEALAYGILHSYHRDQLPATIIADLQRLLAGQGNFGIQAQSAQQQQTGSSSGSGGEGWSTRQERGISNDMSADVSFSI